MTGIQAVLLSAVVTAVAAGCATQAADKVKSDDPLQLSSDSKERLTGQFRRDGVTVRFDSVRVGEVFRFEILRADGSSLVRGELVDQQFVTTVLGGKLRLAYATDDSEEDLVLSGDENAVAELEATPEYAILPWLSHELGVRGYNGRDYPSALAMHMFNKTVAERTGVVLPAADSIGLSVEDQSEEEGYCSRPTANSCYGMCGPGCTCWSFVCGDCCYHSGCARHDSYCRGSGAWNTAKCWTAWGAAFFGC